nr:putative Ig domain-containing protein [Leifsonia psychrotolerans]
MVALKSDGTVVAWNKNGELPVPPTLRATAIAAGGSRTLALTTTGTVVAWELDGTPTWVAELSGLSGITAIAAGKQHGLALKSDSTVVAWGIGGGESVPAGLTGVTSIAAGWEHSYAVNATGGVVAWGGNYFGETTIPLAAQSGVTAVAGGFHHALALKSDGTVVGWGTYDPAAATPPAGLTGITAIAAGRSHSMALRSAHPDWVAQDPPASAIGTQNFSYTFVATGAPLPTYTLKAGSTLPSGVSLSSAGVLSGVPSAGGTFSYTVVATNNGSSVESGPHGLSVQMHPVFAFGNTPPANGSINTALASYQFTTGAVPAATYNLASGSLPSGVTISTTGLLSGTPTTGGTFRYVVRAANGGIQDGYSSEYTLTIVSGPAFANQSPATSTRISVAYAPYTFTAGGTPVPTFAVTAESQLPDGMSLSPFGVLSGTPTETGDFSYTVVASNGYGADAVSLPKTLQVNSIPALVDSTPPNSGRVGTASDSYAFTATGFPAPIFAVSSGVLPAGLTLDAASGLLSGTPTAGGEFTFRVRASNSAGGATTPDRTVTISQAPAFLADSPPTTGQTGTASTSYTFAASGFPAPTFTVSSGTLPAGMNVDSATGVLSGTPTAGGEFSYTVSASNGVGPAVVGQSHTLVVSSAPSFTADLPPLATAVDADYEYTFTASGYPAPTFSVVGDVPGGLTLSAGGVLSGTPTTVGSFTFSVNASNDVDPDAEGDEHTVVVGPGALAAVVVAPQSPGSTTYAVAAGEPLTFTATGQDAHGNTIAGLVPTLATAQDDDATTDLIDGDTVTFYQAGTHTVTLAIGGFSVSVPVTVHATTLATMTLIPNATTVSQGGSLTLRVAGADAFDNSLGDLSNQVTFASDQPTDIISGNTITFPHASPHVITATLGDITASILVDVVPTPSDEPSDTPVVTTPAATPVTPALASTGFSLGSMLLPGLGLLVLGLGLMAGIRRRSRA